MNLRRSAAAALVVYAALVMWLTWPLAAHLRTRLPDTRSPCRYDPLYMGWVLAWETHALGTAPARLRDANIFHPARGTLFYGDTGFGALPYFMPPMLAGGNPTLALNLLFLGCIAATACSLHLVVVCWTGSELAGFIAGWTFLTTRWVLWDFVPTAPSYAVLQYFPWIVYLAARPARRLGQSLRLLPLVVLQCLTDVVYVAASVLAPLGLLSLGRLFRRGSRAAGLRLLVTIGLVLAVLAPIYAAHLAVRDANPDLARQTIWRFTLLPTSLPWGPIAMRFQSPATVTVVSLLLIATGAVLRLLEPGARRGRGQGEEAPAPGLAWRACCLWVVAGLVFSLSPSLYWYKTPINLPPLVVSFVTPLYQVVRSPERLRIASLVGLSLLAGLAFAQCARRLPARGRLAPATRPLLAAAIAAAMYAQYAGGILVPAAVGARPLPHVYPLAAAITGRSPIDHLLARSDGPLLELPVGSGSDLFAPTSHARAMYRSVFHWRPLLNGYDSYWPAGFAERMVLASRLPDPAALAALRDETSVELLLVHLSGLQPSQRAAWLALTDSPRRDDLRLAGRDGDDLLFEVRGR